MDVLLRAPALSRIRANPKRAALAFGIGRTERQVACGLEDALWEAGPNPLTEFADALEFEGKAKMSSDKREKWEALGRFRDELTRFLADKNAAFIGGVAVRSYGGRTAATIDFDVLIEPVLLQEMTAFLESQGGTMSGTAENTYSFRMAGPDLDVDVRVAKSALDEAALLGARRATFQERKLRIVAPAALAAMKVKAYSERKNQPQGVTDRQDVIGPLEAGATTEPEVRQMLEKHRPDLMAELDEILKD